MRIRNLLLAAEVGYFVFDLGTHQWGYAGFMASLIVLNLTEKGRNF